MAFQHGKDTYVSLSTANLSSFSTSSQLEAAADSHDVTTYGQASHVFVGGLLTGTATISGIYDTSTTTSPRALIEPLIGKNCAFQRRPEGTGTGKPQQTCDVVVIKYVETNPVADMITWTVDLQVSGNITRISQT